MTKYITGGICSTCVYFVGRAVDLYIGSCHCRTSTHFCHVLYCEHPWCEEWTEKEEAVDENCGQPLSTREIQERYVVEGSRLCFYGNATYPKVMDDA